MLETLFEMFHPQTLFSIFLQAMYDTGPYHPLILCPITGRERG